jgi:signal peptidase I
MTTTTDTLSPTRSGALDPADALESRPYDDQLWSADPEPKYPARRILVGSLGRFWLWFLIGCLAITVAPLLFGWSSYLIETGSMRPSIKPGDVVITSPNPSVEQLGGRVITFDSPSVPGRVVTHRVVEVDEAGVMKTKGDANATPDSATLTLDDVRGMGRLLVKYVGLPKIWAQDGNVLALGLFLLTLVVAGAAVRWDTEPIPPEDDASPGRGDDPDALSTADVDRADAGGSAVATLASLMAASSAPADAAATLTASPAPSVAMAALPASAGHGFGRRLRGSASIVTFVVLSALYVAAVAIPSAFAAMSASTRAVSNTWSVPDFDYTTELQALTPWVYYKLDETTGTSATDSSGNGRTGTYSSTSHFTRNVDGAFETNTPDRAVTLTNDASCITMANGAKVTPAPTTYSTTAWVKTAAGYNGGGKILGFESARTGVSDNSNGGQFDRHLYMDGSGYIRFGVWLGYSFTLQSTAPVNDGAWHHIATTMGPAGMTLYVDGVLAASSTNTASEVFTNGGWWRFGCGNLKDWTSTSGANEAWSGPNPPTASQNYEIRGTLDELAIWNNVQLTPNQIA